LGKINPEKGYLSIVENPRIFNLEVVRQKRKGRLREMS